MGHGLQFDIRPFSGFKFGGRNQRLKAENVRFRPKISASGIPLELLLPQTEPQLNSCQYPLINYLDLTYVLSLS
jgi:hypothetical protein